MNMAESVALQYVVLFIIAHLTVDNDIPENFKIWTWVVLVVICVVYVIWQCL